MHPEKEQVSLFDRIAISFLSGALAFLTSSIIWLVAAYTLSTTTSIYNLSFTPVIIFTVSMACLGFLTQTNLIADIMGSIWRAIYKVAKLWF